MILIIKLNFNFKRFPEKYILFAFTLSSKNLKFPPPTFHLFWMARWNVSLTTSARSRESKRQHLSQIVRYTGTNIENNVHAHQPYDDKSRISGTRVADPSTSGRNTRSPARGHSTWWTTLYSRRRCSSAPPGTPGADDPATLTKSPL